MATGIRPTMRAAHRAPGGQARAAAAAAARTRCWRSAIPATRSSARPGARWTSASLRSARSGLSTASMRRRLRAPGRARGGAVVGAPASARRTAVRDSQRHAVAQRAGGPALSREQPFDARCWPTTASPGVDRLARFATSRSRWPARGSSIALATRWACGTTIRPESWPACWRPWARRVPSRSTSTAGHAACATG